MAGVAAGLVAEGGAGASAGAGMSGDAMALFGKDTAGSVGKINDFGASNGLSPTQITDMVHKLFGQNPGEPQCPEHHKDPVQSFINLFKHMSDLADVLKSNNEHKSKLPNPASTFMRPEPSAPRRDDEEDKAQQPQHKTKSTHTPSYKPRGA